MAQRVYSDEQIAWLRVGYRHWRIRELTERFNAHFGLDLAPETLKSVLGNNGIRSGRPPGFRRGEVLRDYTWEQVAWLRRERASGPLPEVAARFRARFGVDKADLAIGGTCKRLGIAAGSSGRFERGITPWNKGRPVDLCAEMREQQFAPGNLPRQTMPVGSYRQSKDGYWLLKVSQSHARGLSRKDWRLVHRLTWEAEHGPLPAGHVVVLLDGNPDNCLDPGNLEAVDREVLAALNKRGWAGLTDPAERRAMIEVTRLEVAARRAGRRLGMGRRAIARLMNGQPAPA